MHFLYLILVLLIVTRAFGELAESSGGMQHHLGGKTGLKRIMALLSLALLLVGLVVYLIIGG